MNITVNVSDVDLSSVVGEWVQYAGDGDYATEPKTLSDVVAVTIVNKLTETDGWNDVKKMVQRVREEEIRARVKAEIKAAFAGEIPLTNTYGEATGRTTTLRELIVQEAGKSLQARDSYDRDGGVTKKIIRDEVERRFAKELSDTVAAEKAKVVAAVRAKAADLIATAVKEGVGR